MAKKLTTSKEEIFVQLNDTLHFINSIMENNYEALDKRPRRTILEFLNWKAEQHTLKGYDRKRSVENLTHSIKNIELLSNYLSNELDELKEELKSKPIPSGLLNYGLTEVSYTQKEVAYILNKSVKTIITLVGDGILKEVKHGDSSNSRVSYKREDIIKFLNENPSYRNNIRPDISNKTKKR